MHHVTQPYFINLQPTYISTFPILVLAEGSLTCSCVLLPALSCSHGDKKFAFAHSARQAASPFDSLRFFSIYFIPTGHQQ